MHRPDASSTSSSDAPGAARARPLAALALAFGTTLALLVGAVWAGRGHLRMPPEHLSSVEQTLLPTLAAWQARARPPATAAIALFGDSRVDCGNGTTIGTALRDRLAAMGRATDLVEAAFKGFRPLQFYELLDGVAAGRPRVAVVEVNPGYLWPNPPPPDRGVRFLHLSRRLSLRRAWPVRAALAADGLSVTDPLVYRLEDRLDLLYVVDGIQDRWRQRLDAAGEGLRTRLGVRRGPDRLVSPAVLAEWNRLRAVPGTVAEHPSTIVLRELRRGLVEAGAAVVFYVQPTNVTRWGGSEERERTSELVRAAVGAEPGEWLDLHALVPAGVFRDAGDHMFPEGCTRVADALAPAVEARLDGGPGAP